MYPILSHFSLIYLKDKQKDTHACSDKSKRNIKTKILSPEDKMIIMMKEKKQ